MNTSIREFATWVNGIAPATDRSFSGISKDSRTLNPGELYVALVGETFDGHAFVQQAAERGAAAALVNAAWQPPATCALPLIRVADTRLALGHAAAAWRRRSNACIIGITGSSGKTTTKEMTAALLSAAGPVAATKGNLNNDIGLPLSVLAMPASARFGVFEAGMNHAGEMRYLARILQPDIAVIASIGRAHIEFFGSTEAIACEKAELLRALAPTGAAILCRETAHFDLLCSSCPGSIVVTSLHDPSADYFGTYQPATASLTLVERETGAQQVITLPLPGEHNASNLLLAYAAARTAGLSADQALTGLQRFELPGKRWEIHRLAGRTIINDAYNANPDSMLVAIKTFLSQPQQGRAFLVLGDMLELGEFSEQFHREIGRTVAALAPATLLVVGEDATRYLADEARRAGYPAEQIFCCASTDACAHLLATHSTAHDAILLKASRGMKLETIITAWSQHA